MKSFSAVIALFTSVFSFNALADRSPAQASPVKPLYRCLKSLATALPDSMMTTSVFSLPLKSSDKQKAPKTEAILLGHIRISNRGQKAQGIIVLTEASMNCHSLGANFTDQSGGGTIFRTWPSLELNYPKQLLSQPVRFQMISALDSDDRENLDYQYEKITAVKTAQASVRPNSCLDPSSSDFAFVLSRIEESIRKLSVPDSDGPKLTPAAERAKLAKKITAALKPCAEVKDEKVSAALESKFGELDQITQAARNGSQAQPKPRAN